MDLHADKVSAQVELDHLNKVGASGSPGSLADQASGRELDALVHLHVFDSPDQWVMMKRGLFYRPRSCGYTNRESEAGIYTEAEARSECDPRADEPVTMRRKKTPSYSTDHNAAALVLDRTWQMGVRVTLMPAESAWLVRWMLTSKPEVTHGTWGKTMPEAICRAALKAVRGEQVNKAGENRP